MARKTHWLHSRYRWMIAAVHNPNHIDYHWASKYECDWTYGKGQFQDFIEFVEGTLGQPTATHKFLSRKDQTKGWTKKNLAWQSGKELANKHLNGTRMIKFKNKTKTITAWSDEYGQNYHTVRSRLQWGWTIKQALETPPLY
jgi:hypothetical protein